MIMSGYFNKELLEAEPIGKDSCTDNYLKLNKRIIVKILNDSSHDSRIEVVVISEPFKDQKYRWNFKKYLTDIKYHELDVFT